MRLPAKLWRMANILVEYRLRRVCVRSLPLRLWIETSALCNLRCVMCPNRDLPVDRKGLMDFALFRRIIDESAGFVGDVYLHHRGEPLLNPALCDMIRYARAAGVRTRFHSNGALLDADRVQLLLEAAPDLISFSVDGFSKAVYEQVRRGAQFEKTVAGIVQLAERRRALKLPRPYLIVEKIRFKDPQFNVVTPEVEETRMRFLSAGVDEIIEKQEYAWAEEAAPECALPRRLSACTFPWYAMVICWDGTVAPCPQDFYAAMRMGNVREKTLREIWNDAPYQDLRRRFRQDIQTLALCRKCDRLCRPTVGGLPLQYMVTFLTDQLVGYRRWRRKLGAHERNLP